MRAFSFIEILISVTIASIVFVALFSLASQNISASELIRQQLIASHLAQEGIEIVVNIRSNNWLSGNTVNDNGCSAGQSWRQGLCNGTTYIAQYNSFSIASDASNPYLVVDSDAPLYCYPSIDVNCSGQDSLYRRQIQISTPNSGLNDHEMKVVSIVSWMYNQKSYSISIEDRLYNWY